MRLSELESLISDANLWSNPEKAQKLNREKNNLEEAINNYNQSLQSKNDLNELAELAEADSDDKTLDEILAQLTELQAEVKHAELEALLSGEVDGNDAFLEVHSGSGPA